MSFDGIFLEKLKSRLNKHLTLLAIILEFYQDVQDGLEFILLVHLFVHGKHEIRVVLLSKGIEEYPPKLFHILLKDPLQFDQMHGLDCSVILPVAD